MEIRNYKNTIPNGLTGEGLKQVLDSFMPVYWATVKLRNVLKQEKSTCNVVSDYDSSLDVSQAQLLEIVDYSTLDLGSSNVLTLLMISPLKSVNSKICLDVALNSFKIVSQLCIANADIMVPLTEEEVENLLGYVEQAIANFSYFLVLELKLYERAWIYNVFYSYLKENRYDYEDVVYFIIKEFMNSRITFGVAEDCPALWDKVINMCNEDEDLIAQLYDGMDVLEQADLVKAIKANSVNPLLDAIEVRRKDFD